MIKQFMASAALVSLLASTLPQPAFSQSSASFTGRNGIRVAPVDNTVFEVILRRSGGGAQYWCGAADYARRVLKVGWSSKIYIARGLGPSVTSNRRSAVHFTVDPGAAGVTPIPPSLSLNALKVGDNMSVQNANNYCMVSSIVF